MTRYIISFSIFILLFETNATSQVSATDTLLHGKYAIAFSFSGLNLGGGIGGKYWINENYCLKVEISFAGKYLKTDRDIRIYLANDEQKEIDLNLLCGLARHFKIRNNLTSYIIGSIGVGSIDKWYSTYDASRKQDYRYSDRDIIGGIGIGVEYWITPYISLSGEHTIRMQYSYDNSKMDSFEIQNSTSSIILSIDI